MQFKADFFAKVASVVTWVVFVGFAVVVIYDNAETVAGWARGPAFVLSGTAFLASAFGYLFFPSLIEIPEQVRRGTLDFVLTKPVDSQFWVSFRMIELSNLGVVIGSAGMVGYGVSTASYVPTIENWIAYSICLAAAVALLYALRLGLMTLAIWFVRVDNLWVLEESTEQIARNPVEIFGPPARQILTHILPVALLGTIPARQLVGPVLPWEVGLSVAWAALGLFLTRRFWKFAIVRYSSASS